MPYISDADLKQALADQLGKADASTLSVTDQLITDCNLSAYQDIISRLAARSFTLAQIDAWDRRVEFNRDLGLYWLFVRGRLPHSFSSEAIKEFDRRGELERPSFRLLVNNAAVLPDNGRQEAAGGSIGFGVMDIAANLPTQPPRWT